MSNKKFYMGLSMCDEGTESVEFFIYSSSIENVIIHLKKTNHIFWESFKEQEARSYAYKNRKNRESYTTDQEQEDAKKEIENLPISDVLTLMNDTCIDGDSSFMYKICEVEKYEEID